MNNSVIIFISFCIFSTFANTTVSETSNRRLKMCCARQKDADKDCRRKFCDFNALNADSVGSLITTCSRGPTLMRLWDCASSRVDHTQCCAAKNIQPQCMVYCNARRILPTDHLYLTCFAAFNAIRDCFREHLENNANLYGDK
ncbi:unnamed protein product [Enterobius vermicularis]|uniref:DB domain-containing protein n=1 Tax=Enterobius vermicularis TaxID=51028 RepID=A0A0N4VE35_ENTVE|nr:unnamed protein product [Enterobius vermicularis]